MTDFELGNFLPFRMNRASEWISRRFAAIYEEKYQMSRPQWRTLANIGQHRRLTAKQIASLAHMEKTKVSRAVAALEARNWLSRETDENDRRAEWLQLTPQGRQVYDDLSRIGQKFEQELAAEIGENASKQLLQGLDTLEKKIKFDEA